MAQSKKRKKKKNREFMWQTQVLMIAIVMTAIAAMPTTVMLFFGMMPTAVALFIDRTKAKTRVLTVGAMNLAGCSPFILHLWTSNNHLDSAFIIITDPRTIIVMYSAAGIGYLIDWAVSGLVGSLMLQHAITRREQNVRRQEALVERWGREVTGEILVDPYGFPIATEETGPPSPPDKTPAQAQER